MSLRSYMQNQSDRDSDNGAYSPFAADALAAEPNPTEPRRRKPQRMRVNNVAIDEFLSPLLSDKAEKVAKFLLARDTPQAKYYRVCDLARHKYPYRGPMPEWVSQGGLD